MKPRWDGGESHNPSRRCLACCVANYQHRKQTHGADTPAEVSFEVEVVGISHAKRNSIYKYSMLEFIS